MEKLESITRFLTDNIFVKIKNFVAEENEAIQEIRLGIGRPIVVRTSKGKQVLTNTNVDTKSLKEIVQKLSGYSLYAFEESLGQGFLTIEGGHRVGFCGKAVLENGKVKTLRQISSINFRIAHEVVGCALPFIPYIFEEKVLCHTIIVSPPACGKTTFLRDVIRILAGENYGYGVGIVDERSEIAAMHNGVPQMDLGSMSDVQEDCPKAIGMVFLLRSMSPDVIAVDELGKKEDFEAVDDVLHAGVRLLGSLHGESMEGILMNANIKILFQKIQKGRVIFLSRRDGVGFVEAIFTTSGEQIYGGGKNVDSTLG